MPGSRLPVDALVPCVPLLKLMGVSKSFSGFCALHDVDLQIHRGEVLGLMGENGAGKSTLIKVMAGAHRPDAGSRCEVAGREVCIANPLAARSLGISVIYQEPSLASNLSVAENIFLGRALKRHGMIDRAAMQRGCAGLLARLGADFSPQAIVGSLSLAQRQLVEIARALQFDARILILDEPTTPLTRRETDRLFE